MNKLFLIIVILSLFIFSSCSSDDDNSSSTNQNELEEQMKSGTWRIIKFIDSGDDNTNHFNGYNFNFTSNSLVATNGTNTYNGSWSVINNSSNSSNGLDFNISFSAPPNFEELTEDWDIIAQTSSKIELTHVSGGNGGTDYLTFSKN